MHEPRSAVERRERLMRDSPGDLFLALGDDGDGLDTTYRYLSGSRERAGALLFGGAGFRLPRERRSPGRDYLASAEVRQLLLLPRSDPERARWGEDALETVDAADPAGSGVDAVRDVAGLDAVLDAALRDGGRLWLLRSRPPSLAAAPDPVTRLAARIRERRFGVEVRDGSRRADALRAIKDAGEVAAIERSIAVTREGLRRVARAIAPGVAEASLEAELSHAYRSAGGSHAFGAICGAGRNGLLLHYRANAGTMAEGDLVLVDTGARLDGYCADVTRTYPVTGRFSARQRELYEAVLRAQRAAIEHCVAGVTLADLHAFAWESLESDGLGAHFAHGIGHPLGMDVHDVPQADGPLAPGAVVTIEPGVYLEDEGVGIRIEDDVLVTDGAPRVLSADVPREADDVEAWMAGERA